MTKEQPRRSVSVGQILGSILAILSGAALVASVFLIWIDAFSGEILFGDVTLAGSMKGIDLTQGTIVLAVGVAAALLGIVALLLRRPWLPGILVVLAGVGAIVVASLVLSDPGGAFRDGAEAKVEDAGLPAELANETLAPVLEKAGEPEPGIGLYVALAGGALAELSGALMSIRRFRPAAEAEPTS